MKKNIPQILAEADTACEEGKWEEARRLYRQAGDHPRALAMLTRIDRLEATDKKVRQLMKKADALLEKREFARAQEKYTQALNQAGHEGILKYHGRLEKQIQYTRDLDRWQKRVAGVLEEAARLSKENRLQEARDMLDRFLQEKPEGELYDELSQPVLDKRDRLEGSISDAEHCERARAAIGEQNFRLAIRLAKLVGQDSERFAEAQRILSEASQLYEDYIEPALKRIEACYRQEDWEGAFGELEYLSRDFERNPDWQQWWLRVGRAQGERALEHGRQAVARRKFQEAEEQFLIARRAFERTREKFPEDRYILSRLREAEDLARIAAQTEQAGRHWQEGQHGEALRLLEQTQSDLQQAENQGRSYATIAGVVNTMQKTLQEEIKRIREEERWLENGERLLKEKRPDEAAEEFKKVMDTPLPDHQRRAANGLNRAEEEMRQFEADMERGKAADTPADAVVAFQSAYDRWPAGPGVVAALESALERAGEEAWDAGQKTQALKYFKRIVDDLKLENETAQARIAQSELAPRVEVALERIEQRFRELSENDPLRAADFDDLLAALEALQQETRRFKKLRRQVDTLHRQVHERAERHRQYEDLRQQAENHLSQGEWDDALKDFQDAVDALKDAVSPDITEQLRAWREAGREIAEAERKIGDQLPQLEALYEAIPQGDDPATLLALLTEVESALQDARRAASAVGGELPLDLSRQAARLDDLRERLQEIQEAYDAPQVWDGLSRLQDALERWPDDATLQALVETFTRKMESQAGKLLQEADGMIAEGNLEAADELLIRISALQVGNEEIAERYTILRRRRNFEALLKTIEEDAESKLATSGLPAAVQAREKGIGDLIARPDLPEEVRNVLNKLLRLSRETEGMALGEEEGWERAMEYQEELDSRAGGDPILRRVYNLVDEWLVAARDVAITGLIDSSSQLGQLEEAYEHARRYMQRHPNDEGAVAKLAQTQEALLDKALSSARKRLNRAREARDRGDFPNALGDLASIEEEFFAKLEKRFSGLLDTSEEVSTIRDEAENLKREVARLQEQEESIKPALEEADDLLGAVRPQNPDAPDRLEKVRSILDGLPPLTDMPILQRWRDRLRDNLEKKRAQWLEFKFLNTLRDLKKQLRSADGKADFKAIVEAVDALQDEEEWLTLPSAVREEGSRLRNRAYEQFNALQRREKLAELAATAEEKGDYEAAVESLRELLNAEEDPRARLEIETRLKALKKQLDQTRRRAELMTKAKNLLDEGLYQEARQHLRAAQELGEDVTGLLEVVKLGAWLQKAELEWENGREDRAEGILENLIGQVEAGGPSRGLGTEAGRIEDIARQARQWQKTIREARLKRQKISTTLGQARSHLAGGDLPAARERLEEARTLDPANPEVLKLETEIEKIEAVAHKLSEAQQLFDKEEYAAAQGILRSILDDLPGYTGAVALLEKVKEAIERKKGEQERAAKVEKIMSKIILLAKEHRFQEAKSLLTEAGEAGATRKQVEEARRELDEMERNWRARTIQPIEDALLDEQYADALERCKVALEQVSDVDVKLELGNLQTRIVNTWVEAESSDLRAELRKPLDEPSLNEVVAKVDRFLHLEPAPSPHLRKELEKVKRDAKSRLRQVRETQFRRRLREVEEEMEAGNLTSALNEAEQIQTEAKELDVPAMVASASYLRLEIEKRIKNQEQEARAARRNALLEEAKKGLSPTASRRQIEDALSTLSEIFDIEGYQEDREARELQTGLEEAMEKFDETERTLERAEDLIRQRRYKEAQDALNELEPAGYFKDQYTGLQTLAELLLEAKNDQFQKAWADALEKYRQAIRLKPALSPRLAADMERCRNKLMESVAQEAQNALDATPPKPLEAQEVLDKAKDADWFTPAFNSTVARLRARIASQTKVAEAANWLLLDTPKPDEALNLLREAGRLLPEEENDFPIRQWEIFARAWQDFQTGEPKAALDRLEALQSPLIDLSAVKKFTRQVQEAVARSEQFVALENQIRQYLNADPPRYQEAVATLRKHRSGWGDDPRYAKLHHLLYNDLTTAMNDARRENHYARAISLAESLLKLADDQQEQTARKQVRELKEERRRLLQDLLTQIETAIHAYRLDDDLQDKMERARRVAAPEGHPQLDALQAAWQEKQQLRRKIEEQLKRAKDLQEEKQWKEATQALLAVQKQAPGYAGVIDAVRELQNTLYGVAQRHRHAKEYEAGLNICELALRLGENSPIKALKDEIIITRQSHLDDLRQQIEEALDEKVWNTDAARPVLEQGLSLAPMDGKLLELQTRLQSMEEQIPRLVEQMQVFWQHLNERDYQQAQKICDSLQRLSPPFHEIRLWKDYATSLEELNATVSNSGFETLQKLPQILSRLEQAERSLGKACQSSPPPWFPELPDRRKEAVWNSMALRQIGSELIELYQAYDSCPLSPEGLLRKESFRRDILRKKEEFANRHTQIKPPPVTFDPTGEEGLRVGPETAHSPSVSVAPSSAPSEPPVAAEEPSPAPPEPSVVKEEPSPAPPEPSTAEEEPSPAPPEPPAAEKEPPPAPPEPPVVEEEPSPAPPEPPVAEEEPPLAPPEPPVAEEEPPSEKKPPSEGISPYESEEEEKAVKDFMEYNPDPFAGEEEEDGSFSWGEMDLEEYDD